MEQQNTNYLYFLFSLSAIALLVFRRSLIARALWTVVERCYWVFLLLIFAHLQIKEYYSSLIHGFRLTKDKQCYYAKDYYLYDEETNELRLKNDFDFVEYSKLKREYNKTLEEKTENKQLASAKALLSKYVTRYQNAGSDIHIFTNIKNLDVLQWTKFSQRENKTSPSKTKKEFEKEEEEEEGHSKVVDKHLSFRDQVYQKMRSLVENNKELVVSCFSSPVPIEYFVNSPDIIILRVLNAKYSMIQASIIMNWIYRDFSKSLGYSESDKNSKTPVDLIEDIGKNLGRRYSIDIFECYRPVEQI